MTIKELKELIKNLPDDSNIYAQDSYGNIKCLESNCIVNQNKDVYLTYFDY